MVRDNNAVMGDTWGLETPLWFAKPGTEAKDILSFHRSNDFEQVGNEVNAVRTRVGVTEIANFAKYKITGAGAEDADELFYMWGSSGAQIYHMRWFEQHLSTEVKIHRYGQTMVGLSIAGPHSRDVLSQLTDDPVDNKSFRFLDHRAMDVAGCPCLINRVTYTGDLGYELWMEPAYERQIYLAIKQAGEQYDIADFGMRALLSMRLEKNFPTWFAELRPIYGPYEGAMERFIKLEKNHFIGREKAAEEYADGGTVRRVSLSIDTINTDVMGDEPVWAKTDTNYKTISEPHGYGAPRFDDSGTETPKAVSQTDGQWRVVGWVTSGGYGHSVGKSLAQAYVPKELSAKEGSDFFEVEILGKRYPAQLIAEPLFDPAGSKMRS